MIATPLARFRRVLAAALGTRYYRPLLEAVSLHTPEQIARLPSIAEGLQRLPLLEAERFLADPEPFINPAAPRNASPPWRCPQVASARTAVLMEGVRASNARVFPNGLGWRLAWYRPEAVAGPLGKLRDLSAALRRGDLRLRPLSCAVIVLRRLDEPPLAEEDREQLWRQFQVPVYEHLLGFAGELLARECEAHQGLHLCPDTLVLESRGRGDAGLLLATSLAALRRPMLRFAVPYAAAIEDGLCACGEPGERMVCTATRLQLAGAVL